MSETRIDPNKVNLTEKDIEDWLWEYPETIIANQEQDKVIHWIGRQLKVPSGTIDLVGVTEKMDIVVLEIKNIPIDSSALAQVCRYKMDIGHILQLIPPDERKYNSLLYGFVIGLGKVTNKILFESNALNINVLTFSVNLSLSIHGPWGWTEEFRNTIDNDYAELAHSDDFKLFWTTPESPIIEEAKRIIDEQSEDN